MKLSLSLIIAMLLGTLSAMSKEYQFPPELETLIAGYEKTEKAELPDHDGLLWLEDRVSMPPAKLKLNHNIIIDKRKTRLYVVNVFGDTLASYPVCCSRNMGQKRGKDDCRTPEGTFGIHGVYNSTDWKYKGTGAKCYGPFFISVNTPGFWGIGIHGTNAPGSVPGRHSHGCIRMHNDAIVKVKALVDKDTKITILPDDAAACARKLEEIRAGYVGPQAKIKLPEPKKKK